MLQKVTSEKYGELLGLFAEAKAHFYVRGVLEGTYEGAVYLAEGAAPTAVLVVRKAWCHVLGLPSEPFVAALRRELQSKAPLGERRTVLYFVELAAEWVEVLETAVSQRQLIPSPRLLYRADDALPKLPPVVLPSEFALHPITPKLSQLVDGELPGDVAGVLRLREGAKAADSVAFGFVVVHQGQCVAWAVVDFVVEGAGEIRLVTVGDFRRQGLALATASATIGAAFGAGLTAVWWNVAATNRPSVMLAEKLGLKRHSQPREHILIYPEVGYLVNYAWHFLDNKNFAKTGEVAQTMVQKKRSPILRQYGYFLLGAAAAGLLQKDDAIRHLQRAIDAGFDDLEEMMNCAPLAVLHQHESWPLLLEQLG